MDEVRGPTPPVSPEAPTARDSSADIHDEPATLPEREYQYGGTLGRGGMGEVIAVRDARIGREVAMKRMHDMHPDPDALRRFLREARIQARLDHPAIVPVHELGIDADGRPYFTMKRVAGVTLGERIADRGTPLARLLGTLVDVCHAVELAHARQVVHRDLKPSNIMLGRYGEVYVLDWGIARVIGKDPAVSPPTGGEEPAGEGTATGALLGTPGYMAPEQVDGRPATPASDVYALGAILFEVLTREPLHPRGSEALAHTLAHPQAAPSQRAPTLAIAPELDLLCHAALSRDPERRPTVHELAERLQAYLDGDRDLERRRAYARDHVERARHALEAGERAEALRAAGRAVALDPDSHDATELVTRLIVSPPAELPPLIAERIRQTERQDTRHRMGKAAFAFMSPLALVPALPWLQVRSWPWLVAFYVALVLTGITALWTGRVRGRTSLTFLLSSLLAVTALWSRLAGPLMLTPVMICGCLIALASHPKLITRRARLLGWGLAAVALPFLLEAVGALPPSTSIAGEGLVTTSTVFGASSLLLDAIVFANAVFVLVVGYYASHLGQSAAEAQRKLQVQVWHLEQLVPVATSGAPASVALAT